MTTLRKKNSSRGLLLLDYSLLMVLLATTVLLIVVGLSYVFSNWVLTTGIVTGDDGKLTPTCIPIENTNNLYDCSFRVAYEVVGENGKPMVYHVKVDHVFGPKVAVGDNVYLQYDPKNPSTVIYGNTSYRTFGLLYLSIGSLLLLITSYYWSNIKKQQKKLH